MSHTLLEKPAKQKPQKPSKDFPLFPHSSGQWAKKINGKMRYFGSWDDPQAALENYRASHASPQMPGRPRQAERRTPREDAGSRIASRPKKPSRDFPLFPHGSGQWAKKIRGQMHYFGSWKEDRRGENALRRYVQQRDALLVGATPTGNEVTLRDLVNYFLTNKKLRVESGEMSQLTWINYDRTCKQLLDVFGKERHVASLRPADFATLRARLAKTRGPSTMASAITQVRTIFKYGSDSELTRQVNFGPEFIKPDAVVLRRLRQQKVPRMFSPEEIRDLLDHASLPMRAMIYLGINCGLGNSDCGRLKIWNLDLKNGWLNFPRPKTATLRQCPLWPETVAAVQAVLADRRTPRDEAHADLVFITTKRNAWIGNDERNFVTQVFRELLAKRGILRPQLNFYALRHTFQTIGQRSRDKDAVRFIMGHTEAANDMSAVYSEEQVSNERLTAVTDYVRDWLLNETAAQ
ncbi:MAG: tyrosine-type recombinase/integrase [Pirellulales bacterium]